jgi:hypothetical protein
VTALPETGRRKCGASRPKLARIKTPTRLTGVETVPESRCYFLRRTPARNC